MQPTATQPTAGRAGRDQRLILALAALVAVYFGALAIGAAGPGWPARLATRGQIVATVFMGIFIEALPFLLLGTLASGAIQVFARPEWVRRVSPRRPLPAAIVGATLGLCFLPVCECGTVPATRRLLAKGAPLPLGIAFLLAAPAVNPVVIVSTAIAFRGQPGMVLGRVALTFLVAVLAGLILGRRAAPGAVLPPPTDHVHDHRHADDRRAVALLRHAGDEFFEMTRYLVVGAAIAAIFQAIVPQEVLLTLGQGAIVSVFALMALAAVLSICSTVDSFVALASPGVSSPARSWPSWSSAR